MCETDKIEARSVINLLHLKGDNLPGRFMMICRLSMVTIVHQWILFRRDKIISKLATYVSQTSQDVGGRQSIMDDRFIVKKVECVILDD